MRLRQLAEFLRPDRRKIFASIVLILIYAIVFRATCQLVSFRGSIHPIFYLFIAVVTPAVGLYAVIAEYPLAHLYHNAWPIALAIFVSVTYASGCYICVNKDLVKGVFLYLAAFFIVGGTLIFSAYGYNQLFAFSCEKDGDCFNVCDEFWGDFSVNKNYIQMLQDSCSLGPPTCIDNRCANAENR